MACPRKCNCKYLCKSFNALKNIICPAKLKLSYCPFCGSNDIDSQFWMQNINSNKVCGPGCNSCGATAKSICNWNHRANADIKEQFDRWVSEQQSVPPEIARVINEHFWDLI